MENKQELAILDQHDKSLAVTSEMKEVIKSVIFPDSTDAELDLFIYTCQIKGVHPMSNMIHPIKRGGKVSFQASIDYLRSEAESAGDYLGIKQPEYEYKQDGTLESATVTVIREINGRPTEFTATAFWDEYLPGPPNDFMWKKMPKHMLAKCFSPDTQILTETGFQKFPEVKSRILQVTSSGLIPVDEKPFCQDYGGDMILFDSDDLNFCVTPNHDMITTAGIIEAGTMYELSRARPSFYIPRIVPESETYEGMLISEQAIELAAAFMCDGEHNSAASFRIKVSRSHKVAKIESWGLHKEQSISQRAGATAIMPNGRVITTQHDQIVFYFNFDLIKQIVMPGKTVKPVTINSLSSEQCKVFVLSWAFFDGNVGSGGGDDRSLRVYTSNPLHVGIIETLAVKGGFAVSTSSRIDPEMQKERFTLTLSERDEIPVSRWGRTNGYVRKSSRQHRSLEIVKNESGKVWCVTVPSGAIVVRRNGFSMLCKNCAEALARRLAWPKKFNNLYTPEEMMQSEIDPKAAAKNRSGSVRPVQQQQTGTVIDAEVTTKNPLDEEITEIMAYLYHGDGQAMDKGLVAASEYTGKDKKKHNFGLDKMPSVSAEWKERLLKNKLRKMRDEAIALEQEMKGNGQPEEGEDEQQSPGEEDPGLPM
jgi:hypothetical protein